MQLALSLITHKIENVVVPQRANDGYINATAMCKAVGKQFYDYFRIGPTQEFLKELSAETGLPVSGLVVTFKGGVPELQGTWVHPDVAMNLGQWCSPKFAVAVARWVREWMSGSFTTKLPYHLERYMANRAAIPIDKWSMLNEMTFNLIAPLEQAGYHLPEELVPDVSTGRMFCKWLRDEKKIDTTKLARYRHIYPDGRVVEANLYPLSLLEDFRLHFFNVWLPQKANGYFNAKDPKALPYLNKLVPLPPNDALDDATAKAGFEKIKGKIAAVQNDPKPSK
jgi:KilA domain-containing protein